MPKCCYKMKHKELLTEDQTIKSTLSMRFIATKTFKELDIIYNFISRNPVIYLPSLANVLTELGKKITNLPLLTRIILVS